MNNTQWLDEVKFNEQGLIPAIAQHHQTRRILMVAWMNREALALTAEKNQAVYFSRSRQKLWEIVDAQLKDPTAIYGDNAKTESHDHAHTTEQVDVLAHLGQLMQERKQAEADTSYVASLYKKGINKILEKVGEESVETIIAAKDYAAQNTESNLNDLIYETADLWFHSIVMLGYFDLNPQLIIDELGRRQGLSGLVEKANRNKV